MNTFVRRLWSAARIGCVLAVAAAGARAQGSASLRGTVRDSAGAAIADAEVILREGSQDIRSVRANARGEFVLSDVRAGAFAVWFRRLGYRSVDYNWNARAGASAEITVVLHRVPQRLDPVVVRAEEDRLMRGTSSILGLVVDLDLKPVDEATVDLVGADRGGTTRANGGFLFKPLPLGAYVIRVRKIGYAPTMVTMNLLNSDDREVVIRLRPLAADLDAVVIAEQSGYGRDQVRWDALERRLRWHDFKSRVLGPDELRRYGSLPLDFTAKALGVEGIEAAKAMRANVPRSINPAGTRGMVRPGPALFATGDACILLNGKTVLHQPLRTFAASDLDFLEIYPSGTELTGTIGDRMTGQCAPTSILQHPTYYVLWLKGSK
jgi:hypothetical protein